MMDTIGHPLPHVAAIPPYPPGRPVDAVAREFGLEPGSIVKLASNENPLGCSPAVTRAISGIATRPNIYPDFDSYELRHAIADHVGVSADHILPGEGSSEIIQLATRAYLCAGRSAVIPQYSFQAYAQLTKSAEAEPIIVPACDYRVDLPAVRAAVTSSTHVVFIGTPNNPTGTIVPPEELEKLATELPPHVLLIVDEAYREFVDAAQQPDIVGMLARRRNMLVLRTFSKLHGLAGLRVGYGIGDPELLQMLRRLQLPFSVSSVGQVAAVAALGDKEFAERSRQTNESERARLGEAFAARNLDFIPSFGNFVLVKVGDGATCSREMMSRGVIVRPVGNYGLPEWIRVSVGLPEENDRFLATLDAVLARSPAHAG